MAAVSKRRQRAPQITQPQPKAPGSLSADAASGYLLILHLHPQTVAGPADKPQFQSNSGGPTATGMQTTTVPAKVAGPAAEGTPAATTVKDKTIPARKEPEIQVARGQDEPAAPALAPSPPNARTNPKVAPSPKPEGGRAASRVVVASESAPSPLKSEKSVRFKSNKTKPPREKRAEIESRDYEERLKFREELKNSALAMNVGRGGPEIDSLSKRYSKDSEPEKFAQARQTWVFTRKTPQAKIRLDVRSALGLPESRHSPLDLMSTRTELATSGHAVDRATPTTPE